MDPIPRLVDPAFPIVVSGPSGVGKTVLCHRMLDALPWTVRSVSATTRPPRGDESEGESYFYHDEESFLSERDGQRLAEWAMVHDHYYGTPRQWLDRKLREGLCVVLNIDVQGGLQLRRTYPDALLVFVLPPSMRDLERRLRNRGTDGAQEIERRIETARQEILSLPLYDAVVVNSSLEQATDELIAIVRGERARVARRLPAGSLRDQLTGGAR